MIVLDTDVFTHFTFQHPNVVRHSGAVPTGEPIAVTVITRAEIIKGRTDNLLKAADERELLLAAQRLQHVETILDDFLLFAHQ